MKYLRRQILRFGAIAHTHHDIRVDTLEVELIELGEPARITLGSFDQLAFVRLLGIYFQELFYRYNCSAGERLRCDVARALACSVGFSRRFDGSGDLG